MSCSNWFKLYSNVAESHAVGEIPGGHSGLPQVALFVGSAKRRGIKSVSAHGCRLDSQETALSLARETGSSRACGAKLG